MPRKKNIIKVIHTVALFEAFKGLITLLAGFALLRLVHGGLQLLADHIVKHLRYESCPPLSPCFYGRHLLELAVLRSDYLPALHSLIRLSDLLKHMVCGTLKHGRNGLRYYQALSICLSRLSVCSGMLQLLKVLFSLST